MAIPFGNILPNNIYISLTSHNPWIWCIVFQLWDCIILYYKLLSNKVIFLLPDLLKKLIFCIFTLSIKIIIQNFSNF